MKMIVHTEIKLQLFIAVTHGLVCIQTVYRFEVHFSYALRSVIMWNFDNKIELTLNKQLPFIGRA